MIGSSSTFSGKAQMPSGGLRTVDAREVSSQGIIMVHNLFNKDTE